MRTITINLHDALYAELESAARGVRELGYRPEMWAEEAVESALASRRIARMPSRRDPSLYEPRECTVLLPEVR